MRFVDTYRIIYADDAEFESKHKRDKNGQFATQESNSTESPSNKKEKTEEDLKLERKSRIDRAISRARAKLATFRRWKDIRFALPDVAESLRGNFVLDLPEYGKKTVEIGDDLVEEANKYFFISDGKSKPWLRPFNEIVEIAERQLTGYAHLDELLTSGTFSKEWEDAKGKHLGERFITIRKRFIHKGKSILFTADIKLKRDGETTVVHNTSAEGNAGFGFKSKVMNFKPSNMKTKHKDGFEFVVVNFGFVEE